MKKTDKKIEGMDTLDPMEYAGEQEAPEGGPSLDLEVSDVVEE